MTAMAAPRPCGKAGCGVLTHGRYCPPHEQELQRKQDQERGSSHERGYGARWRKARDWYLQHHPLCAEHSKRGEVVAATVVDHVIPHKGDRTLFWDRANWQGLCTPCHNSKTAREDGGFGNEGRGGQKSMGSVQKTVAPAKNLHPRIRKS